MKTDSRTFLVQKNIIASFLLKGWSGAITLLLVPITLFCLGDYQNGIWLTISSLLLWIDSFDIGLGNGLRNYLAKNLAEGNTINAKQIVSSAFYLMYLIILPIAILIFLLLNFVDPYSVLNVDKTLVPNLNQVLAVTVLVVSVTFIFKLINSVYLALQLPAVSNLIITLGQTLTLVGIFIEKYFGISSLMVTALIYTISPLLVYLIAYPITFYKLYPYLRPSLKSFKLSTASSLIYYGLKFFIIQIASLVLFATSNVLISNFISPEEVTPYQIAYRYFSVVLMIFTVIATPFWSATTDAYHRGDLQWISKSVKKVQIISYLLIALIIVMVLASQFVYKFWIKDMTQVTVPLTISMACYITILIYSLTYSFFLNGFGYLHMQIIMTLLAAVIFIPIAYLSCSYFGLIGMPIALCIANLPGAIVNNIQFRLLISDKAVGIWKR